MTLTQTAHLEIEGDNGTGVFDLEIGYEYTSELTKSYLMGERGQYIREIVNLTPGTGSFDSTRRTGYWLDGGAGNWSPAVQFETGLEDVTWGDGSGGTGPSNVTETDASGADVAAISRLQVLQYWIAKSKSDSGGDTRIHVGEWTDGSYGSSGAFGEAMPIAIQDTQFNSPEVQGDETASLTGSITFAHVATWKDGELPGWLDSTVDGVLDAASFISDE